jgi:hypothetical protein
MRFRLFIMMVLEFFIWGAWLPLTFLYLPSIFSASKPPEELSFLANIVPHQLLFFFSEVSLILNAFPVAAISGMFFSNQFADRNFSAERFLSFSHLVGGISILGLAYTKSFWPFFGLMLVHCLLYVPTISITNSITFANLKDAQEEFGLVRVGGTIGWILAAWPFAFIFVDWETIHATPTSGWTDWIGLVLKSGLVGDKLKAAAPAIYLVAGIASLVLCLYSLTLPHTPAKKAEEGARESLAWLEAIKLLRHPFVLVLWLVTFVDSFLLYCYFNWTGDFLGATVNSGGVGVQGNWIMPVMSIGQVAEVITMLVLGLTLRKLGWKWTMVIGVLGHAVRFGVYAYYPQNEYLIIGVQILHGICYAFFFATVYIFVDEFFPKDARASAQGLFNVMILGLGVLAANSICPYLKSEVFTKDGVVDFHSMFLVPCLISIGAAVVLALCFYPPKKQTPKMAGN